MIDFWLSGSNIFYIKRIPCKNCAEGSLMGKLSYFRFLLFTLITVTIFFGCSSNEPPKMEEGYDSIISTIVPPLSVSTGQIIVLEAKAKDPDQDELSYVWTARNPESKDVTSVVFVAGVSSEDTKEEEKKSALNEGSRVNFSATEGGTYLITVIIDDGNDGKITRSTFISVATTNRQPTLNSTDPITISPMPPHYTNQEIFLVAQADDPDGDKLLYEWSARDQENADAGGLLESTEGTSVKLVADVPGSYLISVLVQDGHGGQDRGSSVIVVTEREE